MLVLGLRNTRFHLLEFIFEAPDVPGLLQKNLYAIQTVCIQLLFATFRVESSEFELVVSV
jgi:hypothetical protein